MTKPLIKFGASESKEDEQLKRRLSGLSLKSSQDNWLKEYSHFNMTALQNQVITNATEIKRPSAIT